MHIWKVMRNGLNSSGIIILLFFCICKCRSKNGTNVIADTHIEKGRVLASAYCQSCHLLPDPSQLDKTSWEKGVLPAMGPFLGIFNFSGKNYPSDRYDRNLGSFYPPKPVLKADEWQAILDYFVAESPDSLQPSADQIPIIDSLPQFTVLTPAAKSNAATCFACFDTLSAGRTILVADGMGPDIKRFGQDLRLIDSVSCTSPVVDMAFQGDTLSALGIGLLSPNNRKLGSLIQAAITKKGKMNLRSHIVLDQLVRPVQFEVADLNGDGKNDYVICEFGNRIGALSWMENRGGGKFTRHILRDAPGAITAKIEDYNHDGKPDIWALFAQGDEGIFLFTNKGNGQFDSERVLRFPPMYGSSHFELVDLNGDGFSDILYTCGDNADYSPVLKPYHGIYIFINDGKNHFQQRYFFPMNGCYKAIARDFDGDGDLDIAAISFFPDFLHRPEEGFVYLENEGDFHFRPYTCPEARLGRWLTMTVGDMDGDGKPDIILGNNIMLARAGNHSPFKGDVSPPFIILKNLGMDVKKSNGRTKTD